MESSDLSNKMALLSTSIRALQKSNHEYDNGDLDESFRIANELTAILDDSGANYNSILKQIGQKKHFPFISTCNELDDRNIIVQHPLAGLTSFNYPNFSPMLNNLDIGRIKPLLDFKKWWQESIFLGGGFSSQGRSRLKRGDFVRDYRNARGAHKDDKIRNEVLRSIMFEGVGIFTGNSENSDQMFPILSLEKAMIRQIGWETENSILLASAVRYPFRSNVKLDKDDLILSDRPFIVPNLAYLSEEHNTIFINLRNWGGVKLNRGRLFFSFGADAEKTDWIVNNQVAFIDLSNLKPEEDDPVGLALPPFFSKIFSQSKDGQSKIYAALAIDYMNDLPRKEVTLFEVLKEQPAGHALVRPFKRISRPPRVEMLRTV
jgi:hypothetical protein